ncbi:MAG: creatininase family protein [Streptosporangiaceae bacterium]
MPSHGNPEADPDPQSTVTQRQGTPVLWAKKTWPEIERLGRTPPHLAILPLGTTEQHGRHLPVDVDVKNCWEIACGVSAHTGVPLLPPLSYGDSRYWEGWPGTLTLQPETLLQVILDISDGLVSSGFRRLLLLNGHIGNGPALAIAEGKIRNRHPNLQVRALSWWDVSERVAAVLYQDAIEGTLRSFHANFGETSVYLHHSPELVDMGKAVNEPNDYLRPRFSYPSRKLTESGVVGQPAGATADQGQRISDMAVTDLVEFIRNCAGEEPPHDLWGIANEA